jgi:hypothetical protein
LPSVINVDYGIEQSGPFAGDKSARGAYCKGVFIGNYPDAEEKMGEI